MGLWDVDKIEYVGRAKGPKEDFAFHYYDADKVVAGKKMKDWLRFGVAWWHTFNQELVDPFGTGTAHRPYYKYTDPMDQALAKVDYAFELFQKLGVEYFCFHDRDIAPEGDTLRETNANLDKVVDKIDENMKSTGVKLLWNTSSCSPTRASCPAPPLLRSPTSTPTPVASSRRAWRSASAWAPRTTCSGVAAKATRTCGTPR